LKKLKAELIAAIKKSVIVTSKELSLKPTGVRVRELKFDCAVDSLSDEESQL